MWGKYVWKNVATNYESTKADNYHTHFKPRKIIFFIKCDMPLYNIYPAFLDSTSCLSPHIIL